MLCRPKTNYCCCRYWGFFFFAIFSLPFLYSYGFKGGQYRNFLETGSANNIEKIEFYSLDNLGNIQSRTKVIEDKIIIEKIASFLTKAQSYSPNRPFYVQEVYLVFYLQNGKKFGLIFQLMKSPDHTVYITFASKNGAVSSFYGNAKIEDEAFLKYLDSIGMFITEY